MNLKAKEWDRAVWSEMIRSRVRRPQRQHPEYQNGGVVWEGRPALWGDIAVEVLGGSENIIRAAGSDSFRGWGAVLTKDNRVLAWKTGTCTYCDQYLVAFQIGNFELLRTEMENDVIKFGDMLSAYRFWQDAKDDWESA